MLHKIFFTESIVKRFTEVFDDAGREINDVFTNGKLLLSVTLIAFITKWFSMCLSNFFELSSCKYDLIFVTFLH